MVTRDSLSPAKPSRIAGRQTMGKRHGGHREVSKEDDDTVDQPVTAKTCGGLLRYGLFALLGYGYVIFWMDYITRY